MQPRGEPACVQHSGPTGGFTENTDTEGCRPSCTWLRGELQAGDRAGLWGTVTWSIGHETASSPEQTFELLLQAAPGNPQDLLAS